MGPVKDTDVLKNVKENNRHKLLKILSPEKNFSVSKFGVKEDDSLPGGRIRMKLTHVNVDCKEEETGFTPIILAVLNGNKVILEDLIFHSANVNCQDSKGNTPLHMAAFSGKAELLDLLIVNKAEVNIQNSDGNTPLHILCQTDHENRIHMILKLLQHEADVAIENKLQQTALDQAAMYNKKDAVSMLLDHMHSNEKTTVLDTPPVRTNTLALVEASLRGYSDIVEMILDYGYNPNCVNLLKDTTPLIEAVRFMRFNVAETLLKYGAKTDKATGKLESPESVVEAFLPPVAADKFSAMFKEYKKNVKVQKPKFLRALSRGYSLQADKDYPLLPNDTSWTNNTPEYCNSCTPNCPNTNILTDDLCSCWIAAEVHHAWTVLDLKYDHTLTGITIYGWDSPQMVKSFQLQKGVSVNGPWSAIITSNCLRAGNKNPNETGMPQTFSDFTATSRYWRLELLSNHGGKCICFQGVRLYGADERIRTLLAENMMEKYADIIIAKGFNTYKKFLLVKDTELRDMVTDAEDRKSILKSLERDRPKEFHPAALTWLKAPVESVKAGEPIPAFSVKSLPGVKTKVELDVADGVALTGQTVVMLQSDSLTAKSEAVFTGLAIHTDGRHALTVRCVDYPRITLRSPQPLEIKSKPALRNSVAMAFDDMEAMLKDLTASLDPVAQ